jgi:hypothetical protein
MGSTLGISLNQEPGELADLVTTGEVAEELVETEDVAFRSWGRGGGERKEKGGGCPGHAYLEGAQGRTRSRLSRGCRGAGVDGDQREKLATGQTTVLSRTDRGSERRETLRWWRWEARCSSYGQDTRLVAGFASADGRLGDSGETF